MTTATSTPARTQRTHSLSKFADKKLSFFGVIRSELLKFRTLTTNWVMTLIIGVVMIGLALMLGLSLNSFFDSMKEQADTAAAAAGPGAPAMSMDQISNYAHQLGASGIDLANMLVGSIAVVFIGSEYATRSIQTTITAVPKRAMAYLAKFVVLSVVSFVMGFIFAAASYFIGSLLLRSEIRDAAPFESGVWLNWLAVAIYFMFMAWMGLGFGALLRNNAGGIMMVVVLFLIMPIVLNLLGLGFDWVNDFLPYTPANLGSTMYSYAKPEGDLTQVEAGWWLALWSIVPAILGYLRFVFTDTK